MLMGEYNHSLDAKGRFIVPAKLREQLGERFVVSKGLDGCLFAFPPEEWAKLEAKIQDLPLTNMRARKFAGRIDFKPFQAFFPHHRDVNKFHACPFRPDQMPRSAMFSATSSMSS